MFILCIYVKSYEMFGYLNSKYTVYQGETDVRRNNNCRLAFDLIQYVKRGGGGGDLRCRMGGGGGVLCISGLFIATI
jgi:hypothetical protein